MDAPGARAALDMVGWWCTKLVVAVEVDGNDESERPPKSKRWRRGSFQAGGTQIATIPN